MRRMLNAMAAIALLAGKALACGLEGDNATLRRVALCFEYPDALHVLGAVSSARLSGRLDRTLGIDSPLTPKERQTVMLRIRGGLWKLWTRLAGGAPAKPPPLSIVLLEHMLWSRIATEEGTLKLTVHLDAPTRGDVVAVTQEPVIAAINSGALSARDAHALGLLRLYGSASDVASVRSWLQGRGPQ
jgi:hypothetical protein